MIKPFTPSTKRNTHQCPVCENWQIYVKNNECVYCTRVRNLEKRKVPWETTRPNHIDDERVVMAGVKYDDISQRGKII